MKTTNAHEPYFEFEDGNMAPILGFERSTGSKYEPLVPDGEGNLVPAKELGDGKIISLNVADKEKEILYG